MTKKPPKYNPNVHKHIGDYIDKEFLQPAKLTKSALALILGIHQAHFGALIRGEPNHGISIEVDLKLCRFFGLPNGYFRKIVSEIAAKKLKDELSYVPTLDAWQNIKIKD